MSRSNGLSGANLAVTPKAGTIETTKKKTYPKAFEWHAASLTIDQEYTKV
jgi:hypothetical protein|tara:strand:- start:386 stop:535 length:150 start_codon:yes stop_codon:yes gene_type:complete